MNGRSAGPGMFLWVLRAVWAGTAVAVAFALNGATHDASHAVRIVAPVVWWAAVAVVVVALVVPSALGLTASRMVVPASVPASVVAWVSGAKPAAGAAALALGLVATLVALSAETAEAMVQGSAYGQEHRFPLRTPAMLLPAVVVMWTLWCASVIGAVVLIGHGHVGLGVVVGVVAVALSWLQFSRQHRLSERWLVIVPAGVVVHDPFVLGETLMVQRTNLRSVHLAPAGSEAADLSGPAGGIPVEVVVKELVTAVFPSSKAYPTGRAVHLQSYLVAPLRPGRALSTMASEGLPVG